MKYNSTMTPSGQDQGGFGGNDAFRQNTLYREGFRKLVNSPLYLVFACALSLCCVLVCVNLVKGLEWLMWMLPDWMWLIPIGIVVGFFAVVLFSVWNIFVHQHKDASGRPIGIGIMLWLHWFMLVGGVVLFIYGFQVSIEWLSYYMNAAKIYFYYFLFAYLYMAYFLVAISFISGLADKFAPWHCAAGSTAALIAVNTLSTVGIILLMNEVQVSFMGISVLVSLTAWVVLLVAYMVLIKKCDAGKN